MMHMSAAVQGSRILGLVDWVNLASGWPLLPIS
jgi:hypothetical protein